MDNKVYKVTLEQSKFRMVCTLYYTEVLKMFNTVQGSVQVSGKNVV
jgi:hypothetical protein